MPHFLRVKNTRMRKANKKLWIGKNPLRNFIKPKVAHDVPVRSWGSTTAETIADSNANDKDWIQPTKMGISLEDWSYWLGNIQFTSNGKQPNRNLKDTQNLTLMKHCLWWISLWTVYCVYVHVSFQVDQPKCSSEMFGDIYKQTYLHLFVAYWCFHITMKWYAPACWGNPFWRASLDFSLTRDPGVCIPIL